MRYAGTGAGLLWSIVNPLSTVFVFWMVFSLGFKAKGPSGIPFDVYFMTAFLPWSFISETLTISTSSIVSNSYLVKKMVFPTETLPVVEIVASTFGHLILLAMTLALLAIHGILPGWGIFQIGYAYVCAVMLVLGLGWLFSSLNVFHRDVGQALSTIINFWFWATPVAWVESMVPRKWHWLLDLNPAYHIVESYRAALLYNTPVWRNPAQLAAFWVAVLALSMAGAFVFRRLKPEFADMV